MIEEKKREENLPYTKQALSDGSPLPIRIGKGLKLREDFYSAMFLYNFNVNYILEDDPEDDKEPSLSDPRQEANDEKEGKTDD